jgi:isopenicillin-N epimerase
MPATFGHPMRAQWGLDPAVAYLNHGTVGCPPLRVLRAQQAIRDEIERQPSAFLLREVVSQVGVPVAGRSRIRAAADAVGAFLGARGEDLAFVDNASTGANAVLRSVPLGPGDEILLTDHTYGAVAMAAEFLGAERGATVKRVALPWPTLTPEAAVEAVAAGIGPKTRLCVIDHITSETALVLPVRAIADRCHAAGVPVLVDGAHAPGALAFDIPSLHADWYTANLHKWAFSPRSCAILWADPKRQDGLHPTVISWGLGKGFLAEFDWVGTKDPSAALAAPEGIRMIEELGWDALRAYNHGLVRTAARMLAERWQSPLSMHEAMTGCMATVLLPERVGSTAADAARVRDTLWFDHKIEVQVSARASRLSVRISAQVYNELSDFERLADAVSAHS